jgi:hypothetical protein
MNSHVGGKVHQAGIEPGQVTRMTITGGTRMGQLGDVLEILFGPDDRFQSVRATIRNLRDQGAASSVIGARATLFGRRKASADSEPKPPAFVTSTSTIWLRRPACARIEHRSEGNGDHGTTLTVTDGARRWERDSEGHVETKEGEAQRRKSSGSGAVDIIIDRHFTSAQVRLFLEHLVLKPIGPTRTADRDCVSVRAIPRPDSSIWPHWLPHGADEYEFHFDLERAALLNIVARREGQVFEVHEVIEIAYDEPLDPSLFVYEPKPGEQVAPASPVVERMSVTAAIARVPFTVLSPTRVPDPDHTHVEVMYHPPRRQGGWSHLAFMYRGSHLFRHLWVKQSAPPGLAFDDLEWEPVASDGIAQCGLRISDPGDGDGVRIVAFEQNGTCVSITSDLDRSTLIDFARSFTAARGSTPV